MVYEFKACRSAQCKKRTDVLFFILVSLLIRAEAQDTTNKLMHYRRLTTTSQSYTTIGTATFVVPAGVSAITATLYGASGGTVAYQARPIAYGGKGGIISAEIPVTSGDVLQINVGGQGGHTTAGFNGGGTGCAYPEYPSGGGGGSTDIRRFPYTLYDRIMVAGGGGGGYSFSSAKGGDGGYPAGENGGIGIVFPQYDPPTGGTATAGGTTTNLNSPYCYANGLFGVGASCCLNFGGGGGGGYWGGGHTYEPGGGGGSSYVDAAGGILLTGHGVSTMYGSGSAYLTFAGDPTANPTVAPTIQPSAQPSSQPSSRPTGQPSTQPSRQPSTQPYSAPSSQPSGQPSYQPSSQPIIQPSMQPSSQPARLPSYQPSSQPTAQPLSQPSTKPSKQPTVQPSANPSIRIASCTSCSRAETIDSPSATRHNDAIVQCEWGSAYIRCSSSASAGITTSHCAKRPSSIESSFIDSTLSSDIEMQRLSSCDRNVDLYPSAPASIARFTRNTCCVSSASSIQRCCDQSDVCRDYI